MVFTSAERGCVFPTFSWVLPAFSWVLSLWLVVGKSCLSVRAINRSTSGFPNALLFCCCLRAGPRVRAHELKFGLFVCLSVG